MADASSIGQGTVVRGHIRGEGDLDIHGRVEGGVDVTGDLLVGETALVKSDVTGRRVIVRGAVAGNVSGTESLVLESGARVVGDLSAPSIGVRPGALVRGNVSTHASGERPAARKVEARTQAARPVAARPQPARPAAPVARPVAPPPPPVRPREVPPPPPPKPQAEVSGPPPPVVPTLKKGAKAQLKKKSAR
jgi:cytoskeletal protein CcmA (bactofilin family)